jgi:hypothetical protein
MQLETSFCFAARTLKIKSSLKTQQELTLETAHAGRIHQTVKWCPPEFFPSAFRLFFPFSHLDQLEIALMLVSPISVHVGVGKPRKAMHVRGEKSYIRYGMSPMMNAVLQGFFDGERSNQDLVSFSNLASFLCR